MSTVGDRLREERKRLGLTQDMLGVTPQTQRLYENGKSSPDADYLGNFARLGADVLYIVTGRHASDSLDMDKERQLAAWAVMPEAAREWLLSLIEVAGVKSSKVDQAKGTGLQALPNTNEVPVEKPWLPIPGRVMPAPKGDYQSATSPDSAAPRIRKVVRKDSEGKKPHGNSK